MIMDMFHDTCHIEEKQRIHFHQFMLDVHQRIHEYKKSIPRQYNTSATQPYDPIPPVAADISEESWLLCFDEFQVRAGIFVRDARLLFFVGI
jgi:protein AFG1